MLGRKKHTQPPGRTPQVAVDEARPHADFFEKALATAGEWTRFGDPKLIGVLALLGLGLANTVSKAGELWAAHTHGWVWGWLAAGGFFVACFFAAMTVIFASLGLFPRTRRKGERTSLGRAARALLRFVSFGLRGHDKSSSPSLLYFAGIAAIPTPEEYERRVRAKTEAELESEIAHQAWEVSRVAAKKHAWARAAYRAVIGFLIAWAVARIALSFVS
jgi:Family of unknown function (DUF5706)